MKRYDGSEWWPNHGQKMFAAIGKAMEGKRLVPETLKNLPDGFGTILPSNQFTVRHVSGKEVGHRKGHYIINVDGPLAGQWKFFSGELEKLARAAWLRTLN